MSSTSGQTESSALWRLVFGTPQIDPDALAQAVEQQALGDDLDYRTRLLIRDSLTALRGRWSNETFDRWLGGSRASDSFRSILNEVFERPGFASIGERLISATKRESVEQFLREVGGISGNCETIYVGGAGALILSGKLSRKTLGIDFADEVPASIRAKHAALSELRKRFSLELTHFRSHYLNEGWKSRAHSLGRFGSLNVFIVDALDVLVGKLFSARTKDRDDVRLLAPQFDRAEIISRLTSSAGRLASDPARRAHAEKNWYLVFGDSIPLVR